MLTNFRHQGKNNFDAISHQKLNDDRKNEKKSQIFPKIFKNQKKFHHQKKFFNNKKKFKKKKEEEKSSNEKKNKITPNLDTNRGHGGNTVFHN